MAAVTASGGGCGRATGALTVGRGCSLPHPGLGHDDDPVTCQVCPPGEIEVVPEPPESGVEAAEGVEDIAADEHSRGVDAQDVAAVVVLALVGLAAGRASGAAAGAGDLLADLEQTGRVVPGGELGARNAHRR